jgi:hypothetical protein
VPTRFNNYVNSCKYKIRIKKKQLELSDSVILYLLVSS